MSEIGLDLTGRQPRRLERADAEWADLVVTMGCGDACPVVPGTRYVDWELDDAHGRPPDEVRAIRDEIERGRSTSSSPVSPERARLLSPHGPIGGDVQAESSSRSAQSGQKTTISGSSPSYPPTTYARHPSVHRAGSSLPTLGALHDGHGPRMVSEHDLPLSAGGIRGTVAPQGRRGQAPGASLSSQFATDRVAAATRVRPAARARSGSPRGGGAGAPPRPPARARRRAPRGARPSGSSDHVGRSWTTYSAQLAREGARTRHDERGRSRRRRRSTPCSAAWRSEIDLPASVATARRRADRRSTAPVYFAREDARRFARARDAQPRPRAPSAAPRGRRARRRPSCATRAPRCGSRTTIPSAASAAQRRAKGVARDLVALGELDLPQRLPGLERAVEDLRPERVGESVDDGHASKRCHGSVTAAGARAGTACRDRERDEPGEDERGAQCRRSAEPLVEDRGRRAASRSRAPPGRRSSPRRRCTPRSPWTNSRYATAVGSGRGRARARAPSG